MAGRGWQGGGRGRGGVKQHAPQLPFQHFPEDANLPDVKFDEIDAPMKNLLKWGYKFQNYFKASPYFLEETTSKVSGNKRARDMDIERYSDKKKTMFTRDSLSQVLMFNQFPKELVQGASGRMPSRKKFRWNPELETKRLDILEQKEERSKGREDKDENRKKDGEDEDEDEEDDEDKENDDEEDFTDDDYNQNEHFDDDEDDYNDVDDYNDEPTYEVD